MDSGYSKHMVRRIEGFFSIQGHEDGNVSFGDVKEGYIQALVKLEKI